MIFTSYTKTDTYYEFIGANGEKQIYPVSSIILTDDESGFIAVKNTASRQTIGLIAKPYVPTQKYIYSGSPVFVDTYDTDTGRFKISTDSSVGGQGYLPMIPCEVWCNKYKIYVELGDVAENTTMLVMTGWWDRLEEFTVSSNQTVELEITDEIIQNCPLDNCECTASSLGHALCLTASSGNFTIKSVYYEV